MIVFVGSNPSQNYKRPYIPFNPESKSGKVLHKWIDLMGLDKNECRFVNLHGKPTEGNRPIKISDMLPEEKAAAIFLPLGFKKIIALGSNVSYILKRLGVDHLYMPHPSPKNRLLNDSKYEKSKLKECKEYVFRI